MISINLNNKENLKLTPIFVKNRIPYIRNENNGCITIALPEKRIPQYKILNKSAVEFSNLMDGTNTVQMILDLLAKKYGENHRTAITADMGIVLSTFLSLKLIIFKKGEFPTMDGITMPLNDKLVVKFAFEHDLKNIVLALDSVKTSDNFTFSSPLAYNAIPDLLQLRSSVFPRLNSNHLIQLILRKPHFCRESQSNLQLNLCAKAVLLHRSKKCAA